jgi:hypothetical protein
MVNTVLVPISKRARQYGYVIWPKRLDDIIRGLFGKKQKIRVEFQNSDLGEKNIDWQHRRISIGYARTRDLGENDSVYRLELLANGRLRISCE